MSLIHLSNNKFIFFCRIYLISFAKICTICDYFVSNEQKLE